MKVIKLLSTDFYLETPSRHRCLLLSSVRLVSLELGGHSSIRLFYSPPQDTKKRGKWESLLQESDFPLDEEERVSGVQHKIKA